MITSCNSKVKVAVITGGHAYDVPTFQQFLHSLAHIEFYVQNLEDYVNATDRWGWYDALVFYNFHQATPAGQEKGWERGIKDSLERIGKSNQGIVVLHHALLAFPNWPFWSEVVGIANRSFDYYHGQQVLTQIANNDHPITQGLQDWEMTDETYRMDSAGSDSHILLTTQHPKSMRTLAWTRQFGQSRVFCYEGGHDKLTFDNATYQTVVERGILWSAGRL
ncbi:MAG: ThuA domain-containing protein [Anaerolineae bacterium]